METSESQKTLRDHFGLLAQKHVGIIMNGDRNKSMDYVYGGKFTNGGMMLGNKWFDVDKNDGIMIFIDDVKYVGNTLGLYELIFKRLSDNTVYTEDDKHKSILKATNAYRRGNIMHNLILSNKRILYKYKYIIASLFADEKMGKGVDYETKQQQDPLRAFERSQRVDRSSAITVCFASSL